MATIYEMADNEGPIRRREWKRYWTDVLRRECTEERGHEGKSGEAWW